MKTLIQLKKKIWQKRKRYFENYLFWSRKIKQKTIEILGEDVKVLVFGSIVKGEWGPNSDIDILIISEKLSKNWEENTWIKTEIKKSIDLFSPFQIHLATPQEYQNWYQKFIKGDFKEI